MKYLIEHGACKGNLSWFQCLYRLLVSTACAITLMLAPSIAIGQSTAESSHPSSGLVNASATVFSSITYKAYTVDSEADLIIISNDTDGSVHRVKVGSAPVSIGVNQINGRVYTANAGDGTVSVIDGKTDVVIATVPVGEHPYSIAVDSAAGKVYVTRTYSDDLMEIDCTTNAVTRIKTGSQDLITIDPKAHSIYLLGYEGGSLIKIDGETHESKNNSVGMHAWGMALNEETGALYVAKTGDAGVDVVDSPLATPKFIPTGKIPCAIGVNSRMNRIYAVNYGDDSVTVIDGKSSRAVITLPTGKRPQAVAVDVVHNLIYVANTQGKSVTVIDGASNKTVATIPAGDAPYALAIDPEVGKLHVANIGRAAFTTLDVSRVQKPAH